MATKQRACRDGYMTESARRKFINYSISKGLMPDVASRMPSVASLHAPLDDPNKPIQFWQLFSVLGQTMVFKLVGDFYARIYEIDSKEESGYTWFYHAFARISTKEHHIYTQAAMWLDCFGAGAQYHGGEYRLKFHHANNAPQVMTGPGAARWIEHMEVVLDAACAKGGALLAHCDGNEQLCLRIRRAINTFLGFFMDDYALQFRFETKGLPFGERNPAIGTNGLPLNAEPAQAASSSINLMNLTEQQIRELKPQELRAALIRAKIDVTDCVEKEDFVKKALRLVC